MNEFARFKLMTKEERQAVLQKKLEELGDTPTTIARSLLNMGIKGKKQSSLTCPVACYLEQYYSWADVFLEVGSRYVQVGQIYEEFYTQIRNSPALREFIDQFDRGTYPDLVKS